MTAEPAIYRAIVIGATGAVGSALVRDLLASARCEQVTILTRRSVTLFDALPGAAKLEERVIDLEALERESENAGRGCTAAFNAMGVGQPRKSTPEEVRRVEIDYAGAFARGTRAAGATHISLLTSVGADLASRTKYLRLKGEAEATVLAAGFPRTSFFRPSLLVTPEIRYGLQDRLTQLLFPIVAPLVPRRFHQIRVEELGRAMRLNAERAPRGTVEVLQYPEFMELLRG